MKRKKVLLAALLTVLLAVFPALACAAAVSVPEPTESFYVADYASVLAGDTKQDIIQKNAELYEKTGGQIVVATVDFLDGAEIEDYCYAMFNEWGIGSGDKNNGVLLLLAIGEDNYYAVQGSGLESALSSGTLGDILYDNLEDDFAAQNYDGGVQKTFAALLSWYEQYYGVAVGGAGIPEGTPDYDGGGDYARDTPGDGNTYVPERYPERRSANMFPAVFLLVVVIVIVSAVRGAGRRRYYGGYPPYYHGPMPPPYYRGMPPFGPFGRGGPFIPPPFGGPDRHDHDRDDDDDDHFGGFGGFGGGGSTRGGGAGRSGGGFGGFGGGGFGGGGFGGGSHSGGGGGTRGGGAGRR